MCLENLASRIIEIIKEVFFKKKKKKSEKSEEHTREAYAVVQLFIRIYEDMGCEKSYPNPLHFPSRIFALIGDSP